MYYIRNPGWLYFNNPYFGRACYSGSLKGVSKSVQVLFKDIEAVMVLALTILTLFGAKGMYRTGRLGCCFRGSGP